MTRIFGTAAAAAIMVMAAGCGTSQDLKKNDTGKPLDYCISQVDKALEQLRPYDYTLSPRNIAPGDDRWALKPVSKELWTEGFWPGVLWYAYEYTKDEKIKTAAEGYTEALEFISKIPAYDHDLGFIIFCSYGNGYRLTGNPAYKEVILNTADRLASLYNPAAGTILSWPREMERWAQYYHGQYDKS